MLKKFDIIFEDKTYSCEIKADNDASITCQIYQDFIINFQGKIALKEVYSQIPAFNKYTIEEIFKAINDLENENLELLNSSNQFKLKIKIKVLKKIKELIITLESKSQSKQEIIQFLLKKLNNNKKRIELLKKEIKKLLKEDEENTIPEIDISKVNIQRKNYLFGKKISVDQFKLLDDGRIAFRLYEKGIVVINPDTLEISFLVKGNFYDYIGIKKNIVTLDLHRNKISVIKLEDTKYQFIEDIKYTKLGFMHLSKLSDGTLLVIAKKDYHWGEIIFYKEKDNSYSKDFSIGLGNDCLFALQVSNNEIIYTERREKMVIYDFVNKIEKIRFDFCDKFKLYFSSDYNVEILNENLLGIIMERLSDDECYIINFREKKLINHFKYDKRFRYIHAIKRKYLFILKKNCILQYKIYYDKIRLINEFETNIDYDGLICLNNENKIKFISYDGQSIYELY